MPHVKQQKLVQDAPAGLQTLNRLSSNLESFKTDFEKEHAPLALQFRFPNRGAQAPYEYAYVPTDANDTQSSSPGAHEHPLIPRGVAYVQQVTTADPSVITSYGVSLYGATGCLQSMQALGVGVYYFPITGFAKVWGRATPWSMSSAVIGNSIHFARVEAASQLGLGGTGLIVRTFRVQTVSGHDILYPFHTGFYLVAFGRRDPQASAPPRMSRRPEGELSPDPMEPDDDVG